jgi:glycosyltransferase involved in cell wall biosynthesis
VTVSTGATPDERLTFTPDGPRVSVFVTSYNHARYVEEALESLRRQTSRDFEVIITDDASTDDCADVIEAWLARTGYPAQFIRNDKNRGICANRNTALARASGSFVCSLSGDDCYEPERIERQLECFLAQPGQVAAVYSDMIIVNAEGRPVGHSFLDLTLEGAQPPQGEIFARILSGNFLPAPATMVRRSAIDSVGGYDESLSYEDLDMWLRLSFRYQFVYLPGALVRYRWLSSSMSNSPHIQLPIHNSYTKILRKWLDAGLHEKMQLIVLDELFRNGAMQLTLQDTVGARETFMAVVNNDSRPQRRLLSRIAMLPGASSAAPEFRKLYRGIKNLSKRLSFRPRRR